MNGTTTSYLLVSTLEITRNGTTDRNSCEQHIQARFLKRMKGPAHYDAESKRYFSGANNFRYVFELKTTKVKLFLCKQLAPASEFLRATHYRYNFMQLLVNLRGQPLAVLNKELIEKRWNKMKLQLGRTYVGDALTMYFKEQDALIETHSPLLPAVSQYLYFGLVFPGIPVRHSSNWSKSRKVELSESEREHFEETISFVKREEGIDYYELKGTTLEGSDTRPVKFEGTICRKPMQMLPERAQALIEFARGEVITKWTFELKKTAK